MDNTIRTAQVLSMTTSIFLSGINIGASILTMPILYTRPTSVSTPFFNEYYNRGAVTLVPLGLFSASCSALVAYLLPSQRSLWALAGVATFGQVPWTALVMMKTVKRLNAIAASKDEQEKANKQEVVGLLRQWTWMNIIRGGLAAFGGLTGVWAIVEGQK